MKHLFILLLFIAFTANAQKQTTFAEFYQVETLYELAQAIQSTDEIIPMSAMRSTIANTVTKVRMLGYDMPVYYNNTSNGYNNTNILHYPIYLDSLGNIVRPEAVVHPANEYKLADSTYQQTVNKFVDNDNLNSDTLIVLSSPSYLRDDVPGIGKLWNDIIVDTIVSNRVNTNPRYADTVKLTAYEQSIMDSEVSVIDKVRKTFTNLFDMRARDREFIQLRERHKELNYWEASHLRDTTWLNCRHLRRKGRWAFRMWIVYDAIPSHKLGREGATLGNGASWAVANTNWPGARKLRNIVIDRWGRNIPFLGWEEDAYREYYKDFTVFGPIKSRTSYRNSSVRKAKRKDLKKKFKYFFRKFGACKRS